MDDAREAPEDLKRLIRTRGNHVYFAASVTHESVMELMMAIGGVKDAVIDAMVRARTQIDDEDEDLRASDILFIGNGSNLLEKEPGRIDIYLHITSNGGLVSAAFGGYDALRALALEGVRLITVASGFVFSAGTLLYLAGEERFVHRTCIMLVHQLNSTVEGGTFTDLKNEVKNQTLLMKLLKDLYMERTGLLSANLKRYFSGDVFIEATEALNHRIAHRLVGGRQEELGRDQ